MYTFLFFFIIFGMAAYAFYSTFLKQNQHSDVQPTHFDLLDDNGDPIPSSSRARHDNNAPRVVVSSADDTKSSVRQLRYFSIKDKGYHVTVWPNVQGFHGIDYLDFIIAGITHGEHIADHLGEFVAHLEADPLNPYDPSAIKILTREGHRVGYVPRDQTQQVRDFTSLPCKCYCYIGENNGTYYSCCYISNPS